MAPFSFRGVGDASEMYMERYCGRTKDMPKGWSVNWEKRCKVGRQNSETRWVESLLVVYLCVVSYV